MIKDLDRAFEAWESGPKLANYVIVLCVIFWAVLLVEFCYCPAQF